MALEHLGAIKAVVPYTNMGKPGKIILMDGGSAYTLAVDTVTGETLRLDMLERGTNTRDITDTLVMHYVGYSFKALKSVKGVALDDFK